MSLIENQIIEVLEEKIKPVIISDGGDVKYLRFSNGVVFIELLGQCMLCSNAQYTLKGFIKDTLQYYIPEIKEVEAINLKSDE